MKFIFRVCSSIFALGLVLGLSACSTANSHEILRSTETCSECHSEEKLIYSVTDAPDAQVCGSSIKVESSESELMLCEAIFTNEEGTSYVPQAVKAIAVHNGEALVENLDTGIWAICIDKGDSSQGVLIKVEEGAALDSIVKL